MRIPAWLFIVGIVILMAATAILSLVSFSVARQVAIDVGNNTGPSSGVINVATFPTPTRVPVQSLSTKIAPVGGANTSTVATAVSTSVAVVPVVQPTLDLAPEWTDTKRINLLLLGIDQRSALNDPGPFRTDTMMIVSIDPIRKTAGILSIPRDLWVSIPGFKQERINNANFLGDANGYPGGGPALAAETVRQVFGIPIDKYLLINFDVFTKVVSTIAPDGVQVCPNEAIHDPNYPDAGNGFLTVDFPAGCQVLNAEKLLQYARTRHGATDFDRAGRQQEVMRALREKVLSVGGVTQFIGQAPKLYTDLTGGFKTNLSLDEILQLGSLVTQIPKDNFHFGVMSYLFVDQAKTTTGDDVLILKTNAVRTLLQQVFNPEVSTSLSDLRSRADAEKASIVVLNNTDQLGLAGKVRDWLAGKQVTIAEVGNMPSSTNTNTIIRVYTGKLWTGKYLAALLGLSEDRIQQGGDGLTSKDVSIVVGPDIEPILSSP
ncbi:MAG: LCP family protein [Anaerolineae bacterium]|nr:LCP family protein [Anaerolineae bacterium]